MTSLESQLAEWCRLAYAEARRLVFDLYPAGGPPAREELDAAQRCALDRLEAAEAERERYRRQSAQRVRDLRVGDVLTEPEGS